MLECGWGLDSKKQALTHKTGDVRVPVELQHRSIVVKGWVRIINEEPKVEEEQLQPKVSSWLSWWVVLDDADRLPVVV